MNLELKEALGFIEKLHSLLHYGRALPEGVKIVLLPQALLVSELVHFISSTSLSERVSIGTQDCSEYNSGSYTGELSAGTIASVGGAYALINHCEVKARKRLSKRYIFEAVRRCSSAEVTPILCLADEELTELKSMIAELSEVKELIYVYEPLWMIGKEKLSSMERIYNSIEYVRENIGDSSLLYGGSIDVKNIATFKHELVDGFLLGRASLRAESLLEISRSYSESRKL